MNSIFKYRLELFRDPVFRATNRDLGVASILFYNRLCGPSHTCFLDSRALCFFLSYMIKYIMHIIFHNIHIYIHINMLLLT